MGPGQVEDDAAGAAFGNAPVNSMFSDSGKTLLVIECRRSVQNRHRNSAANDG
jgi:hypothetical protein